MKKNKIKYKGRLKSYFQWPAMILAVMVLVNILIYLISFRAGIVVSLFVLFQLILTFYLMFRSRPRILNEMISFATQYGQVQKTLLDEFLIPYGILDCDGRVIWMNQTLCHMVGKDKRYRKNIQTLFPEIHQGTLPVPKEVKEVEIHYGKKDYCARLQRVNVEGLAESVDMIEIPEGRNYLIAIYLFDDTELKRYIQENQDQKLVPGLIYLDNYDEALESIEEVRRSLLVALIDRKITKYMANYDGIVKKLEKDKYFVILKYKYLKELEANRFSLLEEVKAVNIGNEMSVTLSIGMGINGKGYLQNYEFSRIAIELALGRGGDQAVIKDNDNISYYGGKSQQMEKNTRVKARVKAQALREFIGNSDNVLVMGHKITDIDSFGAAVGIYRAARLMEKPAHIVLGPINGSIRPWVNLFKESKEFEDDMFIGHDRAEDIVSNQTVLVVVDTNRPVMTECESLLDMTKTIVVLDHHRRSSDLIQNAVLSYIEPFASSTCEMVAEILQYFTDEIRLKPLEADCIYAGIIIDTNNFVTKTGVRTFEAAAFLRRSGADVTRVRKMFRDDLPSYKARAEAVRHAEIFMDCYAVTKCPAEHLESPTIVGAQAANELLNITGIKASFVLTAYQGRVYVSARAIDEVNVQIIMERLGGGGHQNIAGAQLDGITVEEGILKVKEVIKKMTEEGAI
ncbi:MAG TPA: DHH family phosphoesterase [Candidatus Limivivens merdigallinarum]|uniref:Cyclic-di-AMP phosphodiesterase n=1 Tax=Candidatus Limivivens merdigallinarum TaxID=2840859 RepID=A0A9D0ZTW9_9FIRM|nr:DHH family phosphoesterase [Candidatus Limivivens merdigallinarum]